MPQSGRTQAEGARGSAETSADKASHEAKEQNGRDPKVRRSVDDSHSRTRPQAENPMHETVGEPACRRPPGEGTKETGAPKRRQGTPRNRAPGAPRHTALCCLRADGDTDKSLHRELILQTGGGDPDGVPPTQGGPNANKDKPEAEDLSRRGARVKNRLLQPNNKRQAERQAFTVLGRSRCNGEGAAQRRRQGITQRRQAGRFAHPSQGLEWGSSQTLSAGTRCNPIRKEARGRRGRMEASQLAMTGPRRPLVKVALQGGRCKLGNGPSHVSFGIGGSLTVNEQCGGRGKRTQKSHPARRQSHHG